MDDGEADVSVTSKKVTYFRDFFSVELFRETSDLISSLLSIGV